MFFNEVNNWAIELQEEFHYLYLLLVKINKALREISKHLMDEESVTLEIENLPWYLELKGNKKIGI